MSEKGVGLDDDDLGFEQKTNHIFAIGINRYAHQRDLKNPVDDCQDIIDVLCDRYTFDKGNVIFIQNEEATRDNILNQLKEYRKLTAADNLLILFSGHGHYDEAGDEGFWIPSTAKTDAQYITIHDINRHLKAYKAHHVALLIDSCYSGAMTRQAETKTTIDKDLFIASKKLYKRQSRWAMTSGRVELVYDGNEGENSPFARSLIYELKNNEKGMLRFSELGNIVTNLTNRNSDQTPSCNYLRNVNDMNGEFSFILKEFDVNQIADKSDATASKVSKNATAKQVPEKESPLSVVKETEETIETLSQLKKRLKKLLASQNAKAAFELLIEKLHDDSSHSTTAYLRLANLNGLEQDIAQGIATNVEQRKAQANHALKYIIDNLKEDDIIF